MTEMNINGEKACDVTSSFESVETTTPSSVKNEKARRHSDYAVFQKTQRTKPSSDIPTGTKSILEKSKQLFEERIKNHEIDRLINPFSEFYGEDRSGYHTAMENAKSVWKDADKRTKLDMSDMKYGKPVEGTLTEKRGHKARDFIAKNMIDLCETISTCGAQQQDGTWTVTFGALFKAYERINDKVVGLLVRARKHGLLEFPGEMLYQGQDNDVIITLLKVPTFEELSMKYIQFDYEKAQAALKRSEETPSIQ